jgi:hypothetical protein
MFDETDLGTNTQVFYFNLGITNHYTTGYPLSFARTNATAGTVNTVWTAYISRTNFVGFDSLRLDKVVPQNSNTMTLNALIGSQPPD